MTRKIPEVNRQLPEWQKLYQTIILFSIISTYSEGERFVSLPDIERWVDDEEAAKDCEDDADVEEEHGDLAGLGAGGDLFWRGLEQDFLFRTCIIQLVFKAKLGVCR